MEPPEADNGDNPDSKRSFTSDEFRNYMGYNSMGNTQSNPFYLNLSHCDDPDLASKLNKMNLGNADQFRSRASKSSTQNRKTQKHTPGDILKQLNTIDFESAINEKSQEKPTVDTQTNSGRPTDEQVDLRNVHLFNMPPSMQVPDSDSDEEIYQKFNQPPNYKFQRASDFLVSKPLTVISRETWGALPPRYAPRTPNYPIKNVVITYKTETSPCFSQEECMQRMRELQKYHMEKECLSDIPFNFMVGHDGTIYEGRGFQAESSRSLESFPEFHGNRLDVAYFGDYRRIFYPPETNSAIIDLAGIGAEKGYVSHYSDFIDYREGHPPC